MQRNKRVTMGSYLVDMKVVYGDTHRWYECGEIYQSWSSEAVCHKYAGHPGKHAMRRRTSMNEKLPKRA